MFVNNTENLVLNFDQLKVSALSKLNDINQSQIVHTASHKYEEIKPNVNNKDTESNSSQLVYQRIPIKTILHEKEKERQAEVQQAIKKHQNTVLQFRKKLNENYREQFKQMQNMIKTDMLLQESQIFHILEQHDKSISAEHQQQMQLYKKLAERRKKNDEELQAREKRKQMLNSIIDHIKSNQLEFRKTYQEIMGILKSCAYPSELKANLKDVTEKLRALPEHMDDIVTNCKNGKITQEESRRSTEVLNEAKNLQIIIKTAVDILEEKQKQIKLEKEQLLQQQRIAAVKSEQATIQATIVSNVANFGAGDKIERVKSTKYVSDSCFKYYIELQTFLNNYENSYKELVDNVSFKEFKFCCRKAINIPVNAISTYSTQHLLDKYNRLKNLLAGQNVEVSDTLFNACKHPQGIAFCTDLLAKKFVLQGDLMISSKPDAAFCYASVVVALWNQFPDFGKLVLAHFHRLCPYLVPMYLPRLENQSDQEFYISQGYQYTDDVVETQDKFLKRMTGYMTLYAAILITKPKKGQSVNPHSLDHAWRWLTCMVNLPPRLDITATMIHTFLDTTGSSLQKAYGKMFNKLMMFICDNYLPQLQQIDTGGPVTRLEMILQKYKNTKVIDSPAGILPPNFW